MVGVPTHHSSSLKKGLDPFFDLVDRLESCDVVLGKGEWVTKVGDAAANNFVRLFAGLEA